MKMKLILGSIFAFTVAISVKSQTSYDANSSSTPVGGANSSAFGVSALPSNTGANNAANGVEALNSNVIGTDNTANGYQALYSNSNGSGNVANGSKSLYTNDGDDNTAVGFYALFASQNGVSNTAIGKEAMYANHSGSENTALGVNALYSNGIGNQNVAIGVNALVSSYAGFRNVAIGYNTIVPNSGTSDLTAVGYAALQNNYGTGNSAFGSMALNVNNSGTGNTATGQSAMISNSDGYSNVANGYRALYSNDHGSGNTAIGYLSLASNTSEKYNTAIGYMADVGVGASDAGAVGSMAVENFSSRIYMGDATLRQVECVTGVFTTSDGRFKTNISESDVKGLSFINHLRPVVYNFDSKKYEEFLTKNKPDSIRKKYLNKDFEPSTSVRQTGFIAQEVEQAAKTAGYNFNGIHSPENENDNYSLSYSQFVVPLVKAVQEQQVIIDQQKADSQKQIQDLQSQIEVLKQQLSYQQKTGTSTNINTNNPGSGGFAMEQNEPNPFSHETVIKYALPQNIITAVMYVYDLSGKQITFYPINDRGSSSITITSEKLPAGIYIYSIVADSKIMDSKRMIVSDK